MFRIRPPIGEYTIHNWEHFGGVPLFVGHIRDQTIFVHGSAVLVAPGVALSAKHVVEPPLSVGDDVSFFCGGISSQLMLWHCTNTTFVDKCDVAIITLRYMSQLPPANDFKIAGITTRLPSIGEEVTMIGFTAADDKIACPPGGVTVRGRVRMSRGTIGQRYPEGRDSFMLPGPCLEVEGAASGGMSGGPVFDQHGLLVGIVASSVSAADGIGPSYVSLLWPALTARIDAEWPKGAHVPGRPLCHPDTPCWIDRRDALKRISDSLAQYIPWDDLMDDQAMP
jgi:hypothetical protein